jgi:small-conductance mechanosensitive channel
MIIMHFVYGQSITAVAATSGAVALVLGYSSQSMLDEIFAGLAPNVDAPFTKGVSYYSTMSGVK